jgi:hypothetical protein
MADLLEIDDLNRVAAETQASLIRQLDKAVLAYRDLKDQENTEQTLSRLRDLLVDQEAEMLALFKLYALAARRTESPEQIMALWYNLLTKCDTYLKMAPFWHTGDPHTDAFIRRYESRLHQLRDRVQKLFELHA